MITLLCSYIEHIVDGVHRAAAIIGFDDEQAGFGIQMIDQFTLLLDKKYLMAICNEKEEVVYNCFR